MLYTQFVLQMKMSKCLRNAGFENLNFTVTFDSLGLHYIYN